MIRLVIVLCLVSATAFAQVTVGVFAPTEPFPSTTARVELARRLADHVGVLLGKKTGAKVFARAADFAAAVRKGEVTIALVDAPYLATATAAYTVIGVAVRAGEVRHPWQLVTRQGASLDALRGKRVLVPGIGGRERDLVLHVLFSGEVESGYFGAIETAPDTASALAALGLAKSDAAVVPAGVDLPAGVASVLALPELSGPVFVVYAGISSQEQSQLAAGLASFSGDTTVAGLRPDDAEAIRAIARRFTPVIKRGPLAVPAVRVAIDDLIAGHRFSIERTPLSAFVAKPR